MMDAAHLPLWVPPKPAIIRPWEEKPRLAMPITLGMLAKNTKAVGISANNGGNSVVGNATWTHTTTAQTKCLVVIAGLINNAQNQNITGVTFNGTAMTSATSLSQSGTQPHISIWYMLNLPVGAFSIVASGATDRYLGGVSLNLGGVTALDVANSVGNTTASAISVTATSTKLGLVVGGSMVNGAATDTLSGDITTLGSNTATANSLARVCAGGYASAPLAAGTRTVTSGTASTLHAVAIAVFK